MFEQYGDLLTAEELQEILGVGKNTAYELLKSQKIKCFRIGRLWKIPRKSLELYVTENSNL